MSLAGALSPKNFQVYFMTESNAGTSVLASSGMHALDVDSVGFPSLNVNQSTDIRTSAVRLFQQSDYFSENTQRVTEFSVSGVLHNDAYYGGIMGNVMNDTSTPYAVVSNSFSPYSAIYGTDSPSTTGTASTSYKTMTVVLKAPDHTDGDSIVLRGCIVTNFSFSADAGTEGGRYRFSATFQTGKKPKLNEHATLAGATAYSGTDIALSDATVKKINDTTVVMQSFGITIDHPAVFSGTNSEGYETLGRGQELSVTVDATVKLDSATRGWVDTYDSGIIMGTNSFLLTNGTNYSTTIKNAVFTDVSYNEGDVMMLNVSMKAVANSSEDLISIIRS